MYICGKNWKCSRNDNVNPTNYLNYKPNCPCAKRLPFKIDQSKYDGGCKDKTVTRTNEECQKFLQSVCGFCRKTRTPYKRENGTTMDIDVACSPEDRDRRFGSKTEPILSNAKYVDNLKEEIRANKDEIPSLPAEYKENYIKSLRDELILNKITTGHDKNQLIKEIRKELSGYRASNASDSRSKDIQLQPEAYKEDKKRKSRSETGSIKGDKKKEKKGRKSESGDRVDRKQNHKKLLRDKHRSSSRKHKKSTQSLSSLKGIYDGTQAKNVSTVSVQCDLQISPGVDDAVNTEIVKKLDDIQSAFPQIPLAIAQTEKNLEKTFRDVVAPHKVVQERGVSPIKNTSQQRNISEDTTVPTSKPSQNTRKKEGECTDDSNSAQPNNGSSKIGDLLLNIQNIKEGRCLIDGFQAEFNLLKQDIENCCGCKKGNRTNDVENLCDKHVVYVPILKTGKEGSKCDQMSIYSALKTEAYLKRKLEDQIQYIKHQERKLARAKKENDTRKTETIMKELEVAKSYYENLLIKQQNERLLNELQKTMREKTKHNCRDFEKCDKCCLQRQIYDLLKKVRAHISKEIEDSKERLKVQKMPSINIRKPLEVQNILNLDIPPSCCVAATARSNLNYETVIKDDEKRSQNRDRFTQTRIVVDRTTSVEVSRCEVEKPGVEDVSCNCEETEGNVSRQLIIPTVKSAQDMEGAPSRNAETQCDSSCSLIEDARVSAVCEHTQTILNDDDSFLFGFKEYLLNNAENRNQLSSMVDVNLQVDADESAECGTSNSNAEFDLKSKDESFELCQSRYPDEAPELELDSRPDKKKKVTSASDNREAYLREKAKLAMSELSRTSSVRKMVLKSDDSIGGHPTDIEAAIENPFLQPKYRLKPISLITIESLDEEEKKKDPFYHSLTDVLDGKVPSAEKNESKSNISGLVHSSPAEEHEVEEPTKNIIPVEDPEKMSGTDDVTEPQKFSEIPDHQEREIDENANVEHPFDQTSVATEQDQDSFHSKAPEKSNDDSVEVLQAVTVDLNHADSAEEHKSLIPLQEFIEEFDSIQQKQIEHDPNAAEKDMNEELNKFEEVPIDSTIDGQKEKPSIVTYEKKVTLEDSFSRNNKLLDKIPEKTVLSLLSPNVKVVLDRNGVFNNTYFDKDTVRKVSILDYNKDLRAIKSPCACTQKPNAIHSEYQKRMSDLLGTSQFLVSSRIKDKKKDCNTITNYIISNPSPIEGTSCKFQSNISKVGRERLDYTNKCSEFDQSVESSSIVSSEGEVKCNCKNISKGEIHTCPKKKFTDANRRPGIYYKEKVSSHIVLERERKHYQHWVTYYATKKNENESCSSSEKSDTVNDN